MIMMLLRWRFCEIAAELQQAFALNAEKKQVVKNRHLYSPLFRSQNFLDTKKYSAVYNRFQSGSNVFIAKVDPCGSAYWEKTDQLLEHESLILKNQTSVTVLPYNPISESYIRRLICSFALAKEGQRTMTFVWCVAVFKVNRAHS